jgi:predicted phosphodiesterase
VAIALISDIHGNAAALDAVLAELASFGIDDGLVLGDVAYGGDEPARVLDRLAELGWPVILGNTDQFVLDGRAPETAGRLADRHLEQIRAFHATYERDGVLAFHGSPRSYDDILFPDTDDLSPWQVGGYELLVGGHTHFQWTTRVGDAVYANPGSVGAAVYRWNDRRLLPHAEYAVLDGHSVEFRRCAY